MMNAPGEPDVLIAADIPVPALASPYNVLVKVHGALYFGLHPAHIMQTRVP